MFRIVKRPLTSKVYRNDVICTMEMECGSAKWCEVSITRILNTWMVVRDPGEKKDGTEWTLEKITMSSYTDDGMDWN